MTAPVQRVLVTFGSRRGGTAEIANAIAETLRSQGLTVDCVRAAEARDLASYHAFVIGGALYAARWVREARRFVTRNAKTLRAHPVGAVLLAWIVTEMAMLRTVNGLQLVFLGMAVVIMIDALRRRVDERAGAGSSVVQTSP